MKPLISCRFDRSFVVMSAADSEHAWSSSSDDDSDQDSVSVYGTAHSGSGSSDSEGSEDSSCSGDSAVQRLAASDLDVAASGHSDVHSDVEDSDVASVSSGAGSSSDEDVMEWKEDDNSFRLMNGFGAEEVPPRPFEVVANAPDLDYLLARVSSHALAEVSAVWYMQKSRLGVALAEKRLHGRYSCCVCVSPFRVWIPLSRRVAFVHMLRRIAKIHAQLSPNTQFATVKAFKIAGCVLCAVLVACRINAVQLEGFGWKIPLANGVQFISKLLAAFPPAHPMPVHIDMSCRLDVVIHKDVCVHLFELVMEKDGAEQTTGTVGRVRMEPHPVFGIAGRGYGGFKAHIKVGVYKCVCVCL